MLKGLLSNLQIACITELHDKKEVICRVNCFVKSDDIWMSQQLHACHFLVEMRLWDFVKFVFVDDFDRNAYIRKQVAGEFYYGEFTLKSCMSKSILAH